jgi:hypothetical protein
MLINEVTAPDIPAVGDILCLEFGEIMLETEIVIVNKDSILVSLSECTDFLRENFDGAVSIDHFFNVLNEAEYRGRKVSLGKKMPGDVKKYKVYVRKPNGNIVKVEFGDPNMRIKKSNPKRRKSFRARHRCDNPGPRWKARYWSCRNW